VRISSGMPVRLENSIQISGTSTPSRSRQTICTTNSLRRRKNEILPDCDRGIADGWTMVLLRESA